VLLLRLTTWSKTMETVMPIILWLLGVPLVVVVALMIAHVI
jgi:hypothetical protein